MKLRIALAAIALLATTVAAHAETVLLKDLLGEGYVIVGTVLVPGDISAKALNSSDNQDELMITMQRTHDIAFCHLYFAATYSNDTIPDATCFRPSGSTPVAPPSSAEPPPASSSVEPPSAEAPSSSAAN